MKPKLLLLAWWWSRNIKLNEAGEVCELERLIQRLNWTFVFYRHNLTKARHIFKRQTILKCKDIFSNLLLFLLRMDFWIILDWKVTKWQICELWVILVDTRLASVLRPTSERVWWVEDREANIVKGTKEAIMSQQNNPRVMEEELWELLVGKAYLRTYGCTYSILLKNEQHLRNYPWRVPIKNLKYKAQLWKVSLLRNTTTEMFILRLNWSHFNILFQVKIIL